MAKKCILCEKEQGFFSKYIKLSDGVVCNNCLDIKRIITPNYPEYISTEMF